MVEASIFKPGNASRYQDLETVKYRDLIFSAIIAQDSYRTACIRGFRKEKTIYDLLYNTIQLSKKLNINYSIFGTEILLLPISYAITMAYNINSLRESLGQLVRNLDKEDGKWFIRSLRVLQPSYLGKLNIMDYRSIEEYSLYQILNFSAKEDSVSRNMILNYEYSFNAYNVIKSYSDSIEGAIQLAYLKILSEIPDGLIYRKFGGRVALNVSKLASEVLRNPSQNKIKEFNQYLVAHRFNPGSTADIIASGISLYLIDEWYGRNSNNYKFPL